ncbi:DUF5825 family protein [Streptomyces luteireticuli]|uniref:DUF5825 family protein n=1 Tax=Streptomyces luteireticuli TaxID=173858 RepID=UPI00355717E6
MTLTLTLWRDHDPDACALPGMRIGTEHLDDPGAHHAQRLFDAGARHVVLRQPVDLTGPFDDGRAVRTVRTLNLIAALTALAVSVDWTVRPGPGPRDWLRLAHLAPPTAVLGVPDPASVLRTWRHDHYICMCMYRRGPGFVQVRDRRYRELRRFTIDEPHYLAAITALEQGAPRAEDLPPDALADFLAEELAVRVGDRAWWAPYRVRRWPQGHTII